MADGKLITITHRRDFLTAAKGRRFVTPSLILQAAKRDDAHPVARGARIGYTVTKKMGNAVARNRIKRRLREAARRIAPSHARERHDYVLISRSPAGSCDFSELLRDMEFAFSRIHGNKAP